MQEQGAGASNLVTGFGYDQFYARTDGSGTQVPLSDSLQSTVGMTDAAGGLGAQYTYEPYGGTTVAGSGGGSQQFTGRENDGTGLMYYRARYYASGMGRFVSEDPLGFGGGDVNLYGYVGGTPTSYADPLGNARLLEFQRDLSILAGLASFAGNLAFSADYSGGPLATRSTILNAVVGAVFAAAVGGFITEATPIMIVLGTVGNIIQYIAQCLAAGDSIEEMGLLWSALMGLIAAFTAWALGPLIADKIVQIQLVYERRIFGHLTRSGRSAQRVNQAIQEFFHPVSTAAWGFLTGACSNVSRPSWFR